MRDAATSGSIADNTIDNSVTQAGLYIHAGSVTLDLTVKDNTIEDGGSRGVSFSAASMHHIDFEGNTIDSNANQGVYVNGGLVTFEGNTIDDNTQSAIEINVAAGVTIGGTAQGAGNTISTNPGGGIKIDATDTTPVLVLNNTISGNTGPGILILTSNNTIGGTAAGAANVIDSNTGAGVALEEDGPPTGNMISGNSIFRQRRPRHRSRLWRHLFRHPASQRFQHRQQRRPELSRHQLGHRHRAGANATGTLNSTPSTTFHHRVLLEHHRRPLRLRPGANLSHIDHRHHRRQRRCHFQRCRARPGRRRL